MTLVKTCGIVEVATERRAGTPMAAEPKYDMTVYPTAGLVRSQSDGARAHPVTLPSCDCADFVNRKGRLVEVDEMVAVTVCKHVAEFLERVGGWHRNEPSRPVLTYPDVTRQRVRTILAEAGVLDSLASRVLSDVTPGAPYFLPRGPGLGAITIRVTQFGGPQARRYTVTVPA